MENNSPIEIEGWVPAKSISHHNAITIGSRIKIYGEETWVTGFYASFNEGMQKWETIILTTGRGDPFERSLDVIEVLNTQ